MSPVLRLVARIAEDARRSYVEHNTGENNLNNHYNRDDGDTHDSQDSGLPWWGILIIVYTSILFVVFLSAFAYYWKREQERVKAGERFRTGHVVWKATSVATGLWIWSWVFQSRGWCGSDRKRDGATGAGPYHHIEARRNLGTRGSASTAPSSTGTRPTRPNTPAQHGTPANQKPAYTPYMQSKTTFKSPGSKLSHDTFDHHESIPMGLLSPNRNPTHTPPPPYISSPPPVELDGHAIQPQHNSRMY
ncbi:hypothetical protein GGR51DRAFT_181466 [Nemania sp. FL0031]|nr:hypothetical protein GGR51DRAFT_181466 [Nemania sp. FL0031]